MRLLRPTCVTPLSPVRKSADRCIIRLANYVYTPEEGRRYSTELYKLLASGELNVRVHAEYPFTAEGVQQAQKDLTGGETMGKLIIKVAADV